MATSSESIGLAAAARAGLHRPPLPPLGADEIDGSALDRIALVVDRLADHAAVRSPSYEVTYGELDAWSDELAARLLERAATGPARPAPPPVESQRELPPLAPEERPIAILLGHEPAAIVAMVAILKTGRPFVPLDPHLPPERLATILSLAGADTCVCDTGASGPGEPAGLAGGGVRRSTSAVDAPPDPARLLPPWVDQVHVGDVPVLPATARARLAAAAPPRRQDTDPALIVFTSGSTGLPKGVVWKHNTLLFHHRLFHELLGVGPDDRFQLLLPCAFISGISSTFRSLFAGGLLGMFDPRVGGARGLADWLRDERPTSMAITPSLLRTIVGSMAPGERLTDLRHVLTVGEALYARDVVAARPVLPPGAAIVTTYGSSEIGLTAIGQLRADDPLPEGTVPAGWPVAGKLTRLLREDGSEAAPGESGELVVSSRYLSGGYWRDLGQQAARFSTEPDGTPRYRTGDVGRIGPDGQLRITGRLDGMVKVRGYLVEPIEIESALLAADEVAEAVVTADRSAQPPRLVAYVVPAPDTRPSAASIRRLLRSRLPSYMVPSTVVILPALPRTERGKVDRVALTPAPPALAGDPPRNQWEEAIAQLWARVLNLDSVGIHDDFLELGGDSLAAQEVAARLRDEYGVALPTSALAQAPTVAELAALAEQTSAKVDTLRHPDAVPLRTGGSGAPLFCFAGAGGLAIGMMALAANFDGERPVYGLQAHGLERRGIPDWSVRAAARRHARTIRLLQPNGPYLLLGHSFGGLVALETAQLLRQAGADVGLLTIVDSTAPGGLSLSLSGAILPSRRTDNLDASTAPHAVGDGSGRAEANGGSAGAHAAGQAGGPGARATTGLRVALDRARQLVSLPLAGVVRFQGMAQYDVFFNQGRVLTMTYRPKPYPGRTLVFRAAPTVSAQDQELRPVSGPWAQYLTGEAWQRTVVGNHDSILREPLVGQLAEDVRAQIAIVEKS